MTTITKLHFENHGHLLLTCFDFIPCKDKKLRPLQSVEWNYLSVPKLERYNRWGLGTDKEFHLTLYWAYNCLSMLGVKPIHVSKRGPWSLKYSVWTRSISYLPMVWFLTSMGRQQTWYQHDQIDSPLSFMLVYFSNSRSLWVERWGSIHI